MCSGNTRCALIQANAEAVLRVTVTELLLGFWPHFNCTVGVFPGCDLCVVFVARVLIVCGVPLVSLLHCPFFVDLGVGFPWGPRCVVLSCLCLGWPPQTLPLLVAGCVCGPSQKM